MDSSSNVVAQISFFHSRKGGRSVPFGQGFSPRLILDASPIEYFTILNIDETETIFPGDQVKIELKIKGNPGIFLHEGASFDLLEGEKIIGNGTIMKILER